MHGHYPSVPMQPAARLTDLHVCPMVTGVVPHVGGPIVSPGAPTVLIGGLPAARLGDSTAHGGVITLGCFTVLIG
ncbi:PAAR domain-containing protein [Xanthomonas citri]|uniref:PAAR domain-containing protein n=1 Tax=Xanthomonas citri TaxID=346 RepID=UPI001CC0C4AC|nr:PAAR domain-containing protein [Xanthomonas citri]MBZ3928988.1 type VI secretion protein [Xanthomonas citri pv. thirumalacharii]